MIEYANFYQQSKDFMELSKDPEQTAYHISRLETDCVIINNERITRSIIITPKTLIKDWAPQSIEELKKEHFDILLAQKPEVVLLGTGKKHVLLSASLLAPFYDRNVGVEVMHSLAACQTFNVLCGDDRHVVAAIFLS